MKMKMKKCPVCNIYTLKSECPNCGGELKVIYPPKFSVEDKYGKYILSGVYDYGMGEWNNKYFVTELLDNTMILTADSENADICRYVRCNEIPAEVLETVK